MDLNKIPGLKPYDPLKKLCDPDFTARAILECLQNNDPEGVMEIIAGYLDALDKANLLKQTKLAKSTMYSALKHGNPTIKTLAKIMHVPKKTSARRSPRGVIKARNYLVKNSIAASRK